VLHLLLTIFGRVIFCARDKATVYRVELSIRFCALYLSHGPSLISLLYKSGHILPVCWFIHPSVCLLLFFE
jgi:hypothetical protein